MKLSVFIAMTLDGYIARKDGSIDWLVNCTDKHNKNEDFGYNDFIDSVDVVVLGKKSFNSVLKFENWPYSNKKVFVMSRSNLIIPDTIKNNVFQFHSSAKDLVNRLHQLNIGRAYIDGGMIIQSFINECLIDDITVTIIPILIGEGRPLFGKIKRDINLDLINQHNYNGLLKLQYNIIY